MWIVSPRAAWCHRHGRTSLCLTPAKAFCQMIKQGLGMDDGQDAWVLAPALSQTCPVYLGKPLYLLGSDSAAKQ